MRRMLGTGLIVATLSVAGCMSGIGGTWTAQGPSEGPISFGSMTLASDGTFTAEAKYDNQTRVMTGYYEFDGEMIVFEASGQTRSYHAIVHGDTLVISHEGRTVMMKRMPKRGTPDAPMPSQVTYVDG